MNRILHVTLTIWIVCNSFALSQEFAFDNYTPKWSKRVLDSTYVGYTETGIASGSNNQVINRYNGHSHLWNLLSILIHGNKAINVFTNSKNDYQGAYIECRDVKDGKLIWDTRFDFRNDSAQEFADYFFVNDSGDLEVLCFRNVEKPYFIMWLRATISRRIYDINNGKLKLHQYGNTNNSAKFPPLEFYPLIPMLRPYPKEKIEYITPRSTCRSKVFSMDQGILIDTVYLFPRKYAFGNVNMSVEKNKTLVTRFSRTEESTNVPPAIYHVAIEEYDREWKIIKSTDLTNILEPAVEYGASINRGAITVSSLNNTEQTTPHLFKISILDTNYNLIETIDFSNEYAYAHAFKLQGSRGSLFVAGRRQRVNGRNVIDLIKSDGYGNVIKKHALVYPKGKLERIVHAAMGGNDEDLYLSVWMATFKENSNQVIPDSEVVHVMRIDLKELGLVSNEEKASEVSCFRIYPNPARDV
ncbi:MAG: hypothetical protein RML38_11875, partial [Bacteroidia bacterium]|nr:hypothetical protein [Bacteroidia bacterium]